MKQQRIMMGMTITIDIPLADDESAFDDVFTYFSAVDERFSTYKDTSEISRINHGELQPHEYSREMQEILREAAHTESETGGYFSIVRADGAMDPSGVVKGWAIRNAARIIEQRGYHDFLVDAGGDVAVSGRLPDGKKWKIGIRDPFHPQDKVVKTLHLSDCGIATSGSYSRGNHIYNPHDRSKPLDEVVSITVIGPDVYDADRFATAAFAMQRDGIQFIESLDGFEGYQIDKDGIATMTSNFNRYTHAYNN